MTFLTILLLSLVSAFVFRQKAEGIKGWGTNAVRLLYAGYHSFAVTIVWWMVHGLSWMVPSLLMLSIILVFVAQIFGRGAHQRIHWKQYILWPKDNLTLTYTTEVLTRWLGPWDPNASVEEKHIRQIKGMSTIGIVRHAIINLWMIAVNPTIWLLQTVVGAAFGPLYFAGWQLDSVFGFSWEKLFSEKKPLKIVYNGDHFGDLFLGFWITFTTLIGVYICDGSFWFMI